MLDRTLSVENAMRALEKFMTSLPPPPSSPRVVHEASKRPPLSRATGANKTRPLRLFNMQNKSI